MITLFSKPFILKSHIVEYDAKLLSLNLEFKLSYENINGQIDMSMSFWFSFDEFNSFINEEINILVDMDHITRISVENKNFILNLSHSNSYTMNEMIFMYKFELDDNLSNIMKNLSCLIN